MIAPRTTLALTAHTWMLLFVSYARPRLGPGRFLLKNPVSTRQQIGRSSIAIERSILNLLRKDAKDIASSSCDYVAPPEHAQSTGCAGASSGTWLIVISPCNAQAAAHTVLSWPLPVIASLHHPQMGDCCMSLDAAGLRHAMILSATLDARGTCASQFVSPRAPYIDNICGDAIIISPVNTWSKVQKVRNETFCLFL